jgi:transposase-like protein
MDARPLKCPACGSIDVAAIPLSLIESRYYKCQACVVTFRELAEAEEPADVERLNQAFADLYGPSGKPE